MKRARRDSDMAVSITRVMQRTITITNATGSTQTYALFAATPTVTPAISSINNNIILVLRGVASTTGQAYFTLPKGPLYAVCGVSYGGESTVETQVEVLDTRLIDTGRKSDDGTALPGTTLELIMRKGTPNFSNKPDIPPSGNEGCFCIRTSSEFTHSDARAGTSSLVCLPHPQNPFVDFYPQT